MEPKLSDCLSYTLPCKKDKVLVINFLFNPKIK